MVYLIILIIIIVLGVLGQMNYKQKVKNNNEAFAVLEDHVYEVLPDCNKENLNFENFMTDDGQYYIIAKSKEDDVLALVSKDSCYRMMLSKKRQCELTVNYINNDKQFDRITCNVTPKDIEPFTIVISTRKCKKDGMLGKMMLQNAESFKESMESTK